jgi:endonuclease/exonuclease/phosphatase family metal-dependent hydrolase
MAWSVLFWNIQGTAKGNVKLQKVLQVIALVKPDIIGFSEVGLAFPYDAFPEYTFQEYTIQDRNDEDTPKGLALGIKTGNLKFKSEFGPVQRSLFTSTNPVALTRPIVRAWVNDVEVIVAHAPSSGGPLGRSTVANIYDYFRDQCRLSRGVYKGIAMGDFNAAYSPYMASIDEEYEETFPHLNLRKKSVYYHAIQSCDPGWDMTQKSGGVLDYLITCDVFGIVDRTHYDTIKNLNESLYLTTWPSALKTVTTKSGLPKDIQAIDPSLDSAYGLVKGSLDHGFDLSVGPKIDIAGWFIDHRPVIYEIMNAERGPLGARVIQSHILAS